MATSIAGENFVMHMYSSYSAGVNDTTGNDGQP